MKRVGTTVENKGKLILKEFELKKIVLKLHFLYYVCIYIHSYIHKHKQANTRAHFCMIMWFKYGVLNSYYKVKKGGKFWPL